MPNLVSPRPFHGNLSCVFICEGACEFQGSRKLYLVKMNCHECLTGTYNEISAGTYQRGNVGNKRSANPLTLLWLNSLSPWFLETLLSCSLSELSRGSRRVILDSSVDTATRFKKGTQWDRNNKLQILCWWYRICINISDAGIKPDSFFMKEVDYFPTLT